MKLDTHYQLFEAARLAVRNTQNSPGLNKRMSSYGFTPKRIGEGEALLNRAESLCRTKKDRHGERQRIGSQLKEDRAAAYATFRDHVGTARLAFREDPDTLRDLDIKKVSNTSWRWTEQAQAFYTQVMKHTKVMAQYQVKREELQQAQAAIQALIALKEDRQQSKATAEEATRMKDEALRELRQWLRDFHAVAKIATQDAPQLREAYGVVVR